MMDVIRERTLVEIGIEQYIEYPVYRSSMKMKLIYDAATMCMTDS